MICFKCGAEIPEGSTICPVCHADLTLEFAQTDPQETGSVSGGDSPASETAPSSGSLPSVPEEPKPGKKGMKILIAAGVVAAAGAAAAFAFTQMNAKDPKEAVVDAFQTAFSTNRYLQLRIFSDSASFLALLSPLMQKQV